MTSLEIFQTIVLTGSLAFLLFMTGFIIYHKKKHN